MARITIHCVRHAQGFHNLSTAAHALPDPLLTPLGHDQCQTLAQNFPSFSSNKKITHVFASPLRRTLYTALLSFPTSFEGETRLKIVALPELQETSDLPCDTGSSPSVLSSEFSSDLVYLSRVEEGWNSKTGIYSPAAPAIEARARSARLFLRDSAQKAAAETPDQDIEMVVVTHGGYLHYFTEDWVGAEEGVGTGWANTECRSYTFVDGDEGNASLEETKESRHRRKGDEKPLDREEQANLRESTERAWGSSGLVAGEKL